MEGGFWAIRADDGITYDPRALPAEFRRDGLPLFATLNLRQDLVSSHMVGPLVDVVGILGFPDPKVTERLAGALTKQLGAANVVTVDPVMGAEDFGEFGQVAKAPSVLLHVGAVEPGRFAEAQAKNETLPPLHSSGFAPDRERTLKTGVSALVVSALELLGKR